MGFSFNKKREGEGCSKDFTEKKNKKPSKSKDVSSAHPSNIESEVSNDSLNTFTKNIDSNF